MAFAIALPWSEGEERMHRLLKVPEHDNPTSSLLTPQAAMLLPRAPLLALGTLDEQKRPWTTIWGGEPGFARPLGGSIVGMRTAVDRKYDPVVETLLGGKDDGEVVKEQGVGRMVSGLAIDLATRRRVKLYGRMIAGALERSDEEEGSEKEGEGTVQLVVKIEQSLGNCPKYLNKKEIVPTIPHPTLASKSVKLSQEALDLLAKSDLFFVSSANQDHDMDTNHRGGPAGFVRVLSNSDSGAEIVWPEYSGNRLYQTLGNLQITPLAGLAFPDFDTGDVLYVTGTTEILVGKDAAALLPRSNLVVKVKLIASRFVHKGLPFKGKAGEPSPYNPNIRLLTTEGNLVGEVAAHETVNTAKLIKKTNITPTITRFRFSMTSPVRYNAGQWVTMDYSEELDIGYSHMRDDDPRSLNDDFVRTFTVSSPPPPKQEMGTPRNEFDITIRRVGPVTSFLFSQNERAGLELPIRGFGGDFKIEQTESTITPFIAGGVGITPLLGQLPDLDLRKLRLFWTIRTVDAELVSESLQDISGLGPSTTVFLTGSESAMDGNQRKAVENIKQAGAQVHMRRLSKSDLEAVDAKRWYLCAGNELRAVLLSWLPGKEVLFEDFDY